VPPEEQLAPEHNLGLNESDLKATAADTGETSDAVIGRYHLLQKIGEGGMGEVWLAEQKEPIRRRVALKLIKAGMDSRQVIARFESERQALALMDTPRSPRCSMPVRLPRARRTSRWSTSRVFQSPPTATTTG
jgi:serine/threonine protein kinase